VDINRADRTKAAVARTPAKERHTIDFIRYSREKINKNERIIKVTTHCV
jgi:hypothetical protein